MSHFTIAIFIYLGLLNAACSKTFVATRTSSSATDEQSTSVISMVDGIPTGIATDTELFISASGDNIALLRYKIGLSSLTDCSSENGYSSAISGKSISIDISTLVDGDITICIVAGDNANIWQDFKSAYRKSWTKDTYAPEVVTVNPADSATDLATTTSVVATFSEEVAMESINSSSFKLLRASDDLVIDGSFSFNGEAVTFTPDNALEINTQYELKLTTDIKDNASNRLAGAFSSIFTTAVPSVVDFHIFCNNSLFDGNNAGANASDDSAIASDFYYGASWCGNRRIRPHHHHMG